MKYMNIEYKLERCGFCGRYFIGNELLTDEEVKKLHPESIKNAPMGYCPNAQGEAQEQE
jgi:hypothetical protein